MVEENGKASTSGSTRSQDYRKSENRNFAKADSENYDEKDKKDSKRAAVTAAVSFLSSSDTSSVRTIDIKSIHDMPMDHEEAVKALLMFCAKKKIAIPQKIADTLDPNQQVQSLITAQIDWSKVSSDLKDSFKNSSYLDTRIKQHELSLQAVEHHAVTKEIVNMMQKLKAASPKYQIRVKNGGYRVKMTIKPDLSSAIGNSDEKSKNIPTVLHSVDKTSLVTKIAYMMKKKEKPPTATTMKKTIISDINLKLDSGKMYLVLGSPGSGKSTLLKYIANRLENDGTKSFVDGDLSINGVSRENKEVQWSSLVSYVDQIDRLHPMLTVRETLRFAFNCRRGGTHRRSTTPTDDPEINRIVEENDQNEWATSMILKLLGLTRCQDTFVGDDRIRGVSGGERKRVTVGEMLVTGLPILCLDEISTGLDAATTFDICRILSETSRRGNTLPIVSLLQPPPETVALFDEIIFIDQGRILFTGPISDIIPYFQDIGYTIPARMDTCDWLLALPQKEGKDFFSLDNDTFIEPLKNSDFFHQFWSTNDSPGHSLKNELQKPLREDVVSLPVSLELTQKYRISWMKGFELTLKRELLLWWRNKYQLKARLMQDIIVGIVVGTVFWKVGGKSPSSTIGVLFQCQLFICLGMMVKITEQVDYRGIFYKQQDANFFPTSCFILGRSIASFPTAIIDALLFGTVVYWFVGLAPYASNFFMFLLLVFISALSFGLTFSVFSSICKDRPATQAFTSLSMVFMVVFSGFSVQPNVIPVYWIWFYWLNFLSWLLRAVMINEFLSPGYSHVDTNGLTVGQNILVRFGISYGKNGEKLFGYEWTWYAILFALAFAAISTLASVYFLNNVRYATGLAAQETDDEEQAKKSKDAESQLSLSRKKSECIDLPFVRVDMTFKNMHYFVAASTSDDKLELLKGISGYFLAGKMTALMGSSGAGKTTLMDVLSLRKTKGEVVGEVTLNGHPQDSHTFRRCSGYVEQFDVQSPQLTIRETVSFSAKMRLDLEHGIAEEDMEKFINQTLEMLELTEIENLIVGSDLTGGLSFEQKKRLSIAVELVANPSVIFLDEPTSGLDARAASIVMKGLRVIANSGRAVVATIHQPSQAIFYDFDSLLLLKRGGETVYFGELGFKSSKLIDYLESFSTTKPIQDGENPATWMLTTIGSGTEGSSFDYASAYKDSELEDVCLDEIAAIMKNATPETLVKFPSKIARSAKSQLREVLKRMAKVYWRSPSYNRTRIMMGALIALIFGSVYISQRVPRTESDMNSRLTSIYITEVFLGVYSFNTVLSVFEVERNMFYRHQASLMYDQPPLVLAVTIMEIPFILTTSMVFNIFFYFMSGFSTDAGRFFLYYVFFTFNLFIWTYFGQAFMSLFKDSPTAQGFGAVLNSINSLFTGVLIRPQFLSSFWLFCYWVFPAHYILEGLVVSQFYDDFTPIIADIGSPFAAAVNGTETCPNINDPTLQCYGTAHDWIQVSFGGFFQWHHIPWNVLYCIGVIVLVKLISYFALARYNFLEK